MTNKIISISDLKEIEKTKEKISMELYNSIDDINYFYNSLVHLSDTQNFTSDCCLICLDTHSNYDIDYDHDKLTGFSVSDYFTEYDDKSFLAIDVFDSTSIRIYLNKKDGLLFFIGNSKYTIEELLSSNDNTMFIAAKNKAKTMLYNGTFFNLVINRIYELTEKKLKDDSINLEYTKKINKKVKELRQLLGDIKND